MNFSIARTSDVLADCGRDREAILQIGTDRATQKLEIQTREVIRRLLARETQRIGIDLIEAGEEGTKNLYREIEGLIAARDRLLRREERRINPKIKKKMNQDELSEALELRIAPSIRQELRNRRLNADLVSTSLQVLEEDPLYQDCRNLLLGDNWRKEEALLAVAPLLWDEIDIATEKLQTLEQQEHASSKELSMIRSELDGYHAVRRALKIERPTE